MLVGLRETDPFTTRESTEIQSHGGIMIVIHSFILLFLPHRSVLGTLACIQLYTKASIGLQPLATTSTLPQRVVDFG